MPASAPDALEPILGWRVWRLSPIGGALGPIAARAWGAGAWREGVNEARCHMYSTRHRAPGPNCVCGFNALHELPSEYRGDRRYVIGTIAAWGEVDVYRTGFRSQFARILGLLADAPAGSAHRREIEAAAERYRVPALELEQLEAHSLAHARAVGPGLLPGSRPRPIARDGASLPLGATALRNEGRGVLVNRHLAVDHRRRLISVGPTPSLAALASDRIEPMVGLGELVAEGQPLFAARVGKASVLADSPVQGVVMRINEGPPRFEEGPAGAGWLVELRLEAESLEWSGIAWDRRGAEAYRDYVLATRSDADLLLACAQQPAPPEALLDPDEGVGWLRELAQRLDAAVRADRGLMAAIGSLGGAVGFEVEGVESMLLGPPAVGSSRWVRTLAEPDQDAWLRISLGPQELRRYWRGELGLGPDEVEVAGAGDAGAGQRRTPLQIVGGDRGRLLLALSLHKRLFDRTPAVLDELGNPWFKAGDAVADPVRNLEVLAGFERPQGMDGGEQGGEGEAGAA